MKNLQAKRKGPRNLTFRKRLYDPDRPDRKIAIPKKYLKDPNWIRIVEPEEYKKVFPPFTHSVAEELEDYACFVHNTHPVFMTGDYILLKDQIIEHFGDKLSTVFQKLRRFADDISYYELIEICEMNFDETIEMQKDGETLKFIKKKKVS